ncbi:TrmH family RNA methyltransferase [Brevibacterium sp. CCUG 69071]|uniref:TrmH family RNA methyltransferase n=1 Tax=Brevibacterium sp. CCUG 69071 TaxID=2052937 RepID=UPI003FA4BAC1
MTDVALRSIREPAEGLFIAESSKIIRRAHAAGLVPRSFLTSPKWLFDLADLIAEHDVPIFIGTDAAVESLTGFHLHRGALAAMHRPSLPAVSELVADARRIVVIEDVVDHTNVWGSKPAHGGAESSNTSRFSRSEAADPVVDHILEPTTGSPATDHLRTRANSVENVPLEVAKSALNRKRRSRIAIFENIVDHTNLGAAFRSAAAIGVDAVLVTPSCADPLYRRSIRVSMGTVFQVPWTRIDSWPDDIDLIKEYGYVVAGMTLGEGAISLDELVAEDHPHLALVFGTEGQGLTRQADRRLDRRVTIPMMHGVDSLNIAASAAVAFYATR